MPEKKKNSEYANFDTVMRELLKVPHSQIKAKMEAEKQERKGRRRSKKK